MSYAVMASAEDRADAIVVDPTTNIALTTVSTTLTSTLAALTTVVAGFVTSVTIIAAATVRFGGNGFCWFRCFFFVGRARAEQARNG